MATSGSVDFTQTRNQIILDALQTAEIIGLEDSIDDATQGYACRMLNKLVKHWQSKDLMLWNRKEAVLFLNDTTQNYSISSAASSWHVTNSYISTTSSTAAATSATTITLTSVTGMTAADNIGIELDNGTRQWTTISSINTGTKVVTLAASLTSAAASGNTVVSYTNKINRPLRIFCARRYHLVDDVYIPIETKRLEYYKDISKKSTSGSPTFVSYDKQLNAGVLYVWPVASGVKEVIYFTYTDPVEDFDAASDNPDLEQKWLLALTFGLAHLMAVKAKMPDAERFEKLAMQYLEEVMEDDNEDDSLQFSPASR